MDQCTERLSLSLSHILSPYRILSLSLSPSLSLSFLHSFSDCAGCKEEIKQGQSLLALGKQWHVSCFKCHTCGIVLTGEYISKYVATATHAASLALLADPRHMLYTSYTERETKALNPPAI